MSTSRDKIAARIRALRAKTVENGCTEAEAIAAAEKLADILREHNMSVDEAEMRESQFNTHTEQHTDPVGDRLWKIADAAAHLTNTQHWTSRPGVFPVEITFFGFDHEVEVARYMLEICAGAMRRERRRIERERYPRVVRRSVMLPFLDGMADRLAKRLRDMKPTPPPGTGLVVLHKTLVEQAMKDLGYETEESRARGSRTLDAAYLDGLAAGDRVALNRGLRGAERATGLLR